MKTIKDLSQWEYDLRGDEWGIELYTFHDPQKPAPVVERGEILVKLCDANQLIRDRIQELEEAPSCVQMLDEALEGRYERTPCVSCSEGFSCQWKKLRIAELERLLG